MRLEVLDHFPEDLDRVLLQAPFTSFYQTRIWVESIGAIFSNMDFRCLVARDAGSVVGYFPFFRVRKGPAILHLSMPFHTYGGPVVTGGEDAYAALVDAYLGLERSRRVIEAMWVDFWNRGGSTGLPGEAEAAQLLDLEGGFEKIWREKFSKWKRREVRRALRKGLRVVEAKSLEEIKSYYRIYEQRIRGWGERFIYPEELFLELKRRGGSSVKIFLVYRGDRLLGGHMNFYFKDMVIAWNGVTLKEKGLFESTLLYSKCIEHACEKGFRKYNLGSSLGIESLVRYKASFGGEKYSYRIFRQQSLEARVARAIKRAIFRDW